MIVGSIKEDLALEKRVSLTPETAKNIIGLGLKICIEKEYATHLGLKDQDYQKAGVEIKDSSTNKVTKFYKESPFPNYKDTDNKSTILEKGDKNALAAPVSYTHLTLPTNREV